MAEKSHGATGPSADLGKQEISELELEELVRQYHDKARETGQWADYLRSHGGANYLVAINPTEERLRQVYDTETGWYGGEHPLSFNEHQLLTKKHGEMLMDYRENTKHDFDSMKSGEEALDTEDIFSESNLNRALDFSQQVFSLSRKCTKGFLDFNRSVIESCVEVLEKVGQAPPCSFAVIGLGSVARGEATPYSDLEYAFIIEEDTETSYFENLAVESYFRIGNLGETPLKTIGIKRTVTSVSNIPPIGYRIDGISRRAGHIPTGHPDSDQSLILTVDQLMGLYKKEVMSSSDAKRAHDLADLMSSSALIYSYREGAKLYEQFLHRRESYEREEVKDNLFSKRKRLHMLTQDITNYSFRPEFDFQQTKNKYVEAKEHIFRYPTLLATDLNICLTLNSQYSWNTFTKLHELDILTEKDLRCMHIVLALSIYIRTTAYLTRGGQSELLSNYTAVQSTSTDSDRYHVPLNIFLILGCILIPIKQAFTRALETVNSHKFKNVSSDIVTRMQLVMNGFKISKTDFMLRTKVLLFVDKYQLALNYLYRMVGKDKVDSCVEFLKVIRAEYDTDKSDPAEENYLAILHAINYQTGEYEVAMDYLRVLIAYADHPLGIANYKRLTADCMNKLERYTESKSVTEEVILQLKEELGLDRLRSLPDYIKQKLSFQDVGNELSELIMILVSVYTALGVSLSNLGLHESALLNFKHSTEIMELMKKNMLFIEEYNSYVCHGGLACEIATSCNNIASVYNDMGDYTQSLVYHMKALEMREAVYGERTNHPHIASSYNNIGSVCNDVGDYTHSLVYYMRALEMRKAVYGEQTNHPDIASSYNNLGRVYCKMGDYTQSLVYHMKALEMKKAVYGEQTNHSDIAISYNNIGNVRSDVGDYTQSLVYHMKALEMKKAVYGEQTNHSDIAGSYHNIGIVYGEIGNYTQSLVYYMKALEMRKAVYGERTDHSDIAISYHNIGNVCIRMGDYPQSLLYYMKALEMMKVVYGEEKNHSDIASSYNNVGIAHYQMGDYTQSLVYYMKALEVKKSVYGEQTNHSDIASSYNNIGTVYSNMGDYTQSLVYHLKALEIRKAVYGEQTSHSDIANSYNNIGIVCDEMGDYAQSLVYYMKALKMMKTVYGEQTNHSDMASSYSNIGTVYNQMGDYTQSLVYYMKALEMMKVVYGEQTNHSDIASNYNNIGVVYSRMGDYTQSLAYHMNALEMDKAVYGEQTNHSDIAGSYNNIGTVYNKMGDYTQSLVYHMKALEMVKYIYSTQSNKSISSSVALIYTSTGNLYRNLHQHQEALKFYIAALMIPDKNSSQTARVLNRIAQVWVDFQDYRRAKHFLHLSIRQTPSSNKLYQARNYHLMGVCHLHVNGKWSRCWTWLYSALCLHEQIPDGVDSTMSLAKIHITIATLLLHLHNTTVALEHAQKALNISNKLLVGFSGHAECVRVNREAKSLTDSLQLVKMIQHEFPNLNMQLTSFKRLSALPY